MYDKFLNKSLLWAVCDTAQKEIKKLVKNGVDFDLAFVIVEEVWPEDSFWISIQEVEDGSSRLAG